MEILIKVVANSVDKKSDIQVFALSKPENAREVLVFTAEILTSVLADYLKILSDKTGVNLGKTYKDTLSNLEKQVFDSDNPKLKSYVQEEVSKNKN